MKKLYIAPSFFTVNILEEDIIAASERANIDSTPIANFNNPGSGDADDAAVKAHSIWDDEW